LFFFSKTMPVFLFLKDVGYLFLRVKTCQVWLYYDISSLGFAIQPLNEVTYYA
jgi:hypothetical protein